MNKDVLYTASDVANFFLGQLKNKKKPGTLKQERQLSATIRAMKIWGLVISFVILSVPLVLVAFVLAILWMLHKIWLLNKVFGIKTAKPVKFGPNKVLKYAFSVMKYTLVAALGIVFKAALQKVRPKSFAHAPIKARSM